MWAFPPIPTDFIAHRPVMSSEKQHGLLPFSGRISMKRDDSRCCLNITDTFSVFHAVMWGQAARGGCENHRNKKVACYHVQSSCRRGLGGWWLEGTFHKQGWTRSRQGTFLISELINSTFAESFSRPSNTRLFMLNMSPWWILSLKTSLYHYPQKLTESL